MKAKQKIILYVDDDADDRELLAEAIHEASPEMGVLLAENGLKALECLKGIKETQETSLCLIVLDLNMPFLSGRETFEKIKEDKTFQGVPIIVFSSSEKPQDKTLFQQQGIEYFTKPSSITYMGQIVDHMISVCC